MAKLGLTLLGTLLVTVAGKPVSQFRTDKIRGLLIYLALENDRPHQRQSLAALFWPDMVEEVALKNLRQSLHRLQQTLETADPDIGHTLFTITRQTIQCHRPALTADLLTFQDLLTACEAHPHRHLHLCHPCLERLAQAVALYQGELLAGFSLPDADPFEEWLLFWRERLQQQMVAALYNLAAAYEQRGEVEVAHSYAARQVALDPFREEAHRQVMRLLAHNGQHSLALAQYENCRRILRTELGVEPAAETVALYRQIQAEQQGQPVSQSAKPAEMHHFPVQFTPFIGREKELQQIQENFLDPDCRLLTLVGPGGMGKTRLSIRAAEQLAANGLAYPDGVYFFPLAAIRSTELLLTALMTGLAIPLSERGDPQTTLINYLRGRRCLLVLDNFEQLVESAPLLGEVLATTSGLHMLVSSHVPLQLRAERRLLLAGLDYPGEEERDIAPYTPATLLPYSAVRLFVESARQMEPAFHLTSENAGAVLAICRLVRGMPLALELAAAWVRMMDCAAIAEEIGRSLDILSAAPQDMPGRHSGMAAVFSYSWDLLPAAEQTALGQLSVFRGPFTLEAAIVVTEATPLMIARLLDRSLLQRRKDGRYELHELLRQFVQQKTAGRHKGAGRRHSNYYLQLVSAQEKAFYGPQPRQAVAAVQAELSNVRRAWRWAIEQGDRQAIEDSLEGIGRFYQTAALLREGEAMLDQALQGVEATPWLVLWHAYFLFKLGRRAEALRLTHQALAESGADALVRAEAHSQLSEVLTHEGQSEQAKLHAQEAITYFREVSNLERLGRSLRRMVVVCWRSGEHEETLRYFQQAVPIHEATGDKRGLAQLSNSLAGVYYVRNDMAQSLAYVQQSQALYEAIGDKLDAAVVTANLARIYSRMGQFEQALVENQRAIETSQELGDQSGLARDLSYQGYILATLGDFARGLDFYFRALEISRAFENQMRIADFQAGMAAVYAAQGDVETALTYYDLALPVLQEQDVLYHLVGPLLGKAELLYGRGEWAAARTLVEQAQGLVGDSELVEFAWQSRLLAAKLDFVQGDEAGGRQQMEAMLGETNEEAEQAALYYELWRMTQEITYAESAVLLYQPLCRRIPSYLNKKRLAELEAAIS
jgi:DNA-binding SARP family transcriptional activator/predicted ATPase